MANIQACLSSKTDNWATPQDFFDNLNEEFHFTLDPCANEENHKCDLFFTKEQDGLTQDWGGHVVFCNPPYGKEIAGWVRYSYEQSQKQNTTVVMLIPARTDTRYFHDYIYGKAEIRFIKGRLKFGFLQPSVWKRDCGLGTLLLRAVTETKHNSSYADPG